MTPMIYVGQTKCLGFFPSLGFFNFFIYRAWSERCSDVDQFGTAIEDLGFLVLCALVVKVGRHQVSSC